MESKDKGKFIPLRESQIKFYKSFSLYYKSSNNEYILYKPDGGILTDKRIEEGKLPSLYVEYKDKIKVIKLFQKKITENLKKNVADGNISQIKKNLCDLVDETLSEPRSGILGGVKESVDIIISGYSKNSGLLKGLVNISAKDYSTTIHCVNVMALTVGFCLHNDVSMANTKSYGISALLHDVGKTEIPSKILKAKRKLTPYEYNIMCSHPLIGKDIICNDKSLDDSISWGVLEHHEKLDGTGYPKGIKNVSFIGQLLGIIDCYEALTSENRPYRRAASPLRALEIVKKDVLNGKFNKNIFKQFCYSIV